jgi:hypothetical protein
MNAFQTLSDVEMQGVDGGVGALVIGAFALVVIGITVGAGVIAYKSASELVNATQPQQQGSCSGGSK